MNRIKRFILKERYILCIVIGYLLLHLPQLTLLPIFNDEAIYLDWGFVHTRIPGHLYDSLLDGKEPLLLWLFGFFEQFFTDPLVAGRFISILFGCGTLLGIYILTKKLLNTITAYFASILYAIIPLFVFYHRQALMEASIAGIGIWSAVFLLTLFHQPTIRNGILLGILFGIGFFIKSTTFLFIIASFVVVLWYSIGKKQTEILKPYCFALCTLIGVSSLLLINPLFWQTLPLHSRYAYTLVELVALPVGSWMRSSTGFFEIGFLFLTPFVFLSAVLGIYYLIRKRQKDHQIFLLYFLFALLLELVLVKGQSIRYLVPFLPFLVIPASYVLQLFWKKSLLHIVFAFVMILTPLLCTLFLIYDPKTTIIQAAHISPYAPREYIFGQTAGYGISETIDYIRNHVSGSEQVMVTFGLGTGNPENAIDVYLQKTQQFIPLHIDAKLFSGLPAYHCLASNYPFFLVTRHDQLLGLERYMSLAYVAPHPDPTYSVRVYTIKKQCTGQTLSISDVYEKVLPRLQEMK